MLVIKWFDYDYRDMHCTYSDGWALTLKAGSFLMGWWGVVFKGDISSVSDQLAIGLTTVGFFCAWLSHRFNYISWSPYSNWQPNTQQYRRTHLLSNGNWRVDSCKRHLAVMVVGMLILGMLYSLCGILEKREFQSGSSEAQLWLGCMVAPLGCGLDGAASVMAGLSTLKKAVDSKNCDTIVTGIEFGFLGCLSTVSTFIAEFNAMRESHHPWRAYAYAMLTIFLSFGLGTLIYSVPVWTKGYD
ncbi:hypothetical protein CK203_012580 [Vitis vinifera]|uniref:Uncharacterized protein n=1 Tax=Vitis vinifera TaxID=29760 RepID=A0A438KMV9_VITVI|nr:hypothetical protein CK203_012580 [Vitis vinifera]